MKRFVSVCAAVLLLLDGVAMAAVGIVKNGSFENNGSMDYVTPDQRPEYWCDVSFDEFKFSAYVGSDWSTHGDYSLTMYTNMFGTFATNDAVTISQSVYLANVSKIMFDVQLFANNGVWDPNVATAEVLIDNTEIWNSDGLEYNAGQFTGQVTADINQTFKDGNSHVLSLRLKTDTGDLSFVQYAAQWDFVRFDSFCNIPSFLPADFDRDGIVDINDLKILANVWLEQRSIDLTGDGFINLADFAILAGDWMSNTPPDNQCDISYLAPGFIFLDADLNDDGIVDYGDIFVFSNEWLNNGGPCVRADLNSDGAVNFTDYALFIEYWQQTGSLYGL
jgi:hypothetical protein